MANANPESRKGCSNEHVSPRQQYIILEIVSQTEVQWKGLLEEPPTSSHCPLYQIRMFDYMW